MNDAEIGGWLHIHDREMFHALRTALAATASLLIARLIKLPEAYWAAVTTIIVMQSTLGAAWAISKQRLVGTAVGALLAAALAIYAGTQWGFYCAAILAAGLICAVFAIGRNAFRYAGITVTIVMLVPRTHSYWMIALHRFIEISLGIAVGLAITAVWPEPNPKEA
jgi:uncharacterized membrane protein YccC